MRIAILAVLIAGTAVASCNRDDVDPVVLARRTIPAELPGCYEIDLDSSSAAPPPGLGIPPRRLRDTIDLAMAGATDRGKLVLGMYPWSVDSLADTMRIGEAVGMEHGGTQYVLGFRPRSDTLRGRLVLHGDVGPPFVHDGGRIMALRIACRGRAADMATPSR